MPANVPIYPNPPSALDKDEERVYRALIDNDVPIIQAWKIARVGVPIQHATAKLVESVHGYQFAKSLLNSEQPTFVDKSKLLADWRRRVHEDAKSRRDMKRLLKIVVEAKR